jgi:hypothetical protein
LEKDKNLGGVCGFMGLYLDEQRAYKNKEKRKKCEANYENF